MVWGSAGKEEIENRSDSLAAKPAVKPKKKRAAAPKAPRRAPGRPKLLAGTVEKFTFSLLPDEPGFLRELAGKVQRKTGAKLSMSAMIRALIQALQESKLDLTGVQSVDEMREILAKKLAS